MKVIDTIWSTNSQGCIGIVVVEDDDTKDRKAYIGVGEGRNEKVDTQEIIDWGNQLPLDTIIKLKGLLEKKKGVK